MKSRRSLQEWVHWLEVGAGGRWVARVALILGVILLSLRIGYTQFHGPLTETTLAQAVVARQLVDGKGFTTLINYPQTVAWMKDRADRGEAKKPYQFDAENPLPELHQAPLYPVVIAGALKVFPGKTRAALFDTVPKPPDGFGADYVLLVLNIVLLWVAAWLTHGLARRLFDEHVAGVATLGLLLSAPVWSATIALGGMPLLMVLTLAFFHALVRIDEGAEAGKTSWRALAAAGVVSGLMFLADYAAGVALLAALGWNWLRFRGRERLNALAITAGVFLLVAGPWMIRNVVVSGNPVGLAWHGIVLKAGDPTAEPETVRTTLSAAVPAVDLDKLGNKVLTSLKKSFRDQLWAGGGLFFSAFFVTGLVYRFRDDRLNRVRWLFVATLGLLVMAQAFFDSGEGERLPVVYATPLIVIFGAGFFAVLVASSDALRAHARWAAVIMLAVQALPLAHDVVEPRRHWHFSYPPYYPPLFVTIRAEIVARGGAHPSWVADVPAGAAWYSGQRVWARPATLRDFYGVCQEQTQVALVLTPHTLDRPFFSELTKRNEADGRLGDWSEVYAALLTNRFPAGFPLSLPQKVADNFYVLIDPLATNTPARRQ
ncbi:MAG: glycosyltransferase family 39 protein [Nibricoccus sp.]